MSDSTRHNRQILTVISLFLELLAALAKVLRIPLHGVWVQLLVVMYINGVIAGKAAGWGDLVGLGNRDTVRGVV